MNHSLYGPKCVVIYIRQRKRFETEAAVEWRRPQLEISTSPVRPVVPQRPDLTQCIHELVLESQLPHKTVNLMFW